MSPVFSPTGVSFPAVAGGKCITATQRAEAGGLGMTRVTVHVPLPEMAARRGGTVVRALFPACGNRGPAPRWRPVPAQGAPWRVPGTTRPCRSALAVTSLLRIASAAAATGVAAAWPELPWAEPAHPVIAWLLVSLGLLATNGAGMSRLVRLGWPSHVSRYEGEVDRREQFPGTTCNLSRCLRGSRVPSPLMTASRDAAVPMRLCICSNARCPRSGFVLAARAYNRRSVLCQCQAHCWGRAASRLVMWPLTLLLPHVGCGVSQLTLEELPGSSLR